jgi:hypothetical protein
MTSEGTPPGVSSAAARIPALLVGHDRGRRLGITDRVAEGLAFCTRVAELQRRLDRDSVPAIVIETRDADGVPVPAAIRGWVERNPGIPVIVWTAGSDSALREILDLSAAGGDIRLVLRPRDDLSSVLDRLLALPTLPHPGAVPSLLRGVVLPAPPVIQPELTLAVYHAWPRPRVQAWADSVGVTRQALDRRLRAAQLGTASLILHHFSAAEIAIRLTQGVRLKELAAAMGRPDERSLRRRLALLGTRTERLRDEADFRALMPRIAAGIQLSG